MKYAFTFTLKLFWRHSSTWEVPSKKILETSNFAATYTIIRHNLALLERSRLLKHNNDFHNCWIFWTKVNKCLHFLVIILDRAHQSPCMNVYSFLIRREAEWPRRILVPTFSYTFFILAFPLACFSFLSLSWLCWSCLG